MVTDNQQGQAALEYLLLTALIVFILTAFFRSNLYDDFFGEDASFIRLLNKRMRYSYRHAIGGSENTVPERYPALYVQPNHASYMGNSETRFFGPAEGYPK